MKKTIFITALAAISVWGCKKKETCPVCHVATQKITNSGNLVTTISSMDTTICKNGDELTYPQYVYKDTTVNAPGAPSVRYLTRATCK